MRPLEEFRQKNGFTYKELHKFLKDNGINISYPTVFAWCLESRIYVRFPGRQMIPRLSELTGIRTDRFLYDAKDVAFPVSRK